MPVKETMNLRQIQCRMAQIIMRPLVEEKMDRQWLDGKDTHKLVDQFIKPNKALDSLARLEIYNQQYWIRLLDSLQEDFPGLQAILGQKRFEQLCVAYIENYPSQSYSLNHLGVNLPEFILKIPELTHPHGQLAHEMATFEWAEIKAHDGQLKKVLESKYLQGKDPAKLILKMQPHITILELNYALDDFILRLNDRVDKSVESNAFVARIKKQTKVMLPEKTHTYMVVYRLNNAIYYKRINADQYFLLQALKGGKTIAQACHDLMVRKGSRANVPSLTKKLNQYFADWRELKWFCR